MESEQEQELLSDNEQEPKAEPEPVFARGSRRIHPLQVVATLLITIAFFLFHAGSPPACDYGYPTSTWELAQHGYEWEPPEPDCEPDGWDEWGDDFLDATGFSKSTKNIIGFVFFMLAFYCWSYYHKTQKNEEPEKLPESFSEPEAEANWWEEETE